VKTSRQKILDYFRMHPIASAGELSRAMLMTPANARHHLNILVEQGALVQVGERAPAKGRGRPERN
jgi:predicted ArsR family transcriptional regulator